ncbi:MULTISPECIES: histidine phosphatase family protein [Pseudomonas]|jgi:broad specificity phosphatase PhoE|uniref:Phosphoglycerate mutase family protein n=1 Tax=Pseudomonas putida (strain ATCC 47054 / DSM 6125 / CFBP 8728 / NCIMB 11950 / KT2440) TaxID=160488 RepID=Q88EL2_PSEPK|nr:MULTISPECIES: histidine phosphatase family protein [Pseudomonas]AAN70025.1 Phosphoglycerate mutase family protein [Pseudomonas putida KT2440]KMU96466.1 phosphoglycerate kinase [Pseudomonas putida]KMY28618.1 phosphoglycerate kinase [Pseudomonas putida]MDD2080526.1 histidine phosphatase family protein [Pseudomonas putida]PXZ48448.1 histidine phosphatase family protein [Pseudomonas sp. SMT-1]
MKRIKLVRHGESAANAGQASRNHESIPLTHRGLEQAITVARSFTKAPELIVASPFSRAQATAQETSAIFPTVAIETWPIQEFTYLAPARCVDTTVAQRRDWVDAYWARAEPAFCDGEGAESFLDFVYRAQAFLKQLAGHSAANTVVFSHGQFLNAVAWLLERRPQSLDRHAMADWRRYEIENHIPNGCGFYLSQSSTGAEWVLGHRNY